MKLSAADPQHFFMLAWNCNFCTYVAMLHRYRICLCSMPMPMFWWTVYMIERLGSAANWTLCHDPGQGLLRKMFAASLNVFQQAILAFLHYGFVRFHIGMDIKLVTLILVAHLETVLIVVILWWRCAWSCFRVVTVVQQLHERLIRWSWVWFLDWAFLSGFACSLSAAQVPEFLLGSPASPYSQKTYR